MLLLKIALYIRRYRNHSVTLSRWTTMILIRRNYPDPWFTQHTTMVKARGRYTVASLRKSTTNTRRIEKHGTLQITLLHAWVRVPQCARLARGGHSFFFEEISNFLEHLQLCLALLSECSLISCDFLCRYVPLPALFALSAKKVT